VEARAQLDAAATSYALQPNDLDRVTGTVGDALDRVFRLLDALALIAVLVAGLGMVNTFSMSVLERGREIGVLRATGMTRRQVWGMVVVEAGILGVIGAVVGAVSGLAVGMLLVYWSSGGFGIVVDPPWLSIGLAVCFGVLVSITAAIYRQVWPVGSRLCGLFSTSSPTLPAGPCGNRFVVSHQAWRENAGRA